MKDPRDPKKSFKVRFPTPPPTRIHQKRKHYTKDIRRPNARELIQIAEDEDIHPAEVRVIEWESEQRKILEEGGGMPYVNQKTRDLVDNEVDALIKALYDNHWDPGMLNYVFSRVVNKLFKLNQCYTTINDLVGTLENVKAEFLRRKVAPYEDQKIKTNGDLP